MKRYTKIRINEITLLLTMGLLIFAISSNSIHAQQVLPGTTVVPPKAPNTAVVPPKIHAVKITSPAKGQQVPIGNNLVVSGTSSDDSNSNCQVSVIANGKRPYQPALASGPGGANDYSKWSFTLSPKYTAIKDGQNKITSKITCSDNPTVGSYYSVNVTGLSTVKQAATSTLSSTPPSPKTTTTLSSTHAITPTPLQPPKSTLSSTPPSPKTTTTTTTHVTTPNTITAKIDGVKITSPAKGQQVPIGNNLVVSGTSLDNATSNCQVYVNLNHIKPNQPALASGPRGANDYSQWTVTLPPSYAFLNAGENKITAKYSCPSNPSVIAFDSVNVTGAGTVQQSATTRTNNAISPTTSHATNINTNTGSNGGDNTKDHNTSGGSKDNSGQRSATTSHATNPNTSTAKISTVKITSPNNDQQVRIGNNLVVSGTSSDNSNSHCQVSVIANDIKPYQPALASGPGGANDYSKWSFTLSPKYTAIKDGQNKITATNSCGSNDPRLIAFDSVNVIGVAAVKQDNSNDNNGGSHDNGGGGHTTTVVVVHSHDNSGSDDNSGCTPIPGLSCTPSPEGGSDAGKGGEDTKHTGGSIPLPGIGGSSSDGGDSSGGGSHDSSSSDGGDSSGGSSHDSSSSDGGSSSSSSSSDDDSSSHDSGGSSHDSSGSDSSGGGSSGSGGDATSDGGSGSSGSGGDATSDGGSGSSSHDSSSDGGSSSHDSSSDGGSSSSKHSSSSSGGSHDSGGGKGGSSASYYTYNDGSTQFVSSSVSSSHAFSNARSLSYYSYTDASTQIASALHSSSKKQHSSSDSGSSDIPFKFPIPFP